MFGSISWNSKVKLPDAKLDKDSSKCHTDHSKYRVHTHSLQFGGGGGRFKRVGVMGGGGGVRSVCDTGITYDHYRLLPSCLPNKLKLLINIHNANTYSAIFPSSCFP